jgi:hypothetical protein
MGTCTTTSICRCAIGRRDVASRAANDRTRSRVVGGSRAERLRLPRGSAGDPDRPEGPPTRSHHLIARVESVVRLLLLLASRAPRRDRTTSSRASRRTSRVSDLTKPPRPRAFPCPSHLPRVVSHPHPGRRAGPVRVADDGRLARQRVRRRRPAGEQGGGQRVDRAQGHGREAREGRAAPAEEPRRRGATPGAATLPSDRRRGPGNCRERQTKKRRRSIVVSRRRARGRERAEANRRRLVAVHRER